MTYSVIIRSKAYLEIDEAYDYYELQSPGLGDKFKDEVKSSILYLEKYPEHFAEIGHGFRQTLLHRFPFVIVYKIIDNRVLVFAVFHTSRNPNSKFL